MANVKTAISIPAPLFAKVERAAKEMDVSRSELFALAVEDYLRQRENRRLLKKIDTACDGGSQQDETYRTLARKSHRRTVEGEW